MKGIALTCNLLHMKTCSKCLKDMLSTPEFFSRSKRANSGLASWCKECESLHRKLKYLENSESIKERNRIWKSTNKEAQNQYFVDRRASDTLFKLSSSLRNRTSKAIRNGKFSKKMKLSEYLGCSLEFLKQHLESQFKPGMSWDNYGEWHIDHVIPLASALQEKELYALCHYLNLQPLWAIDNLSKGNKVA